ncbi:MAG: hypothetical protein CFK52_04765 [Chloracidobacterium sp. CP2_5A]|nr:MAG: hypothetical protein CFK52_04765 [Chloracidobacterium sp. CP2_5A]
MADEIAYVSVVRLAAEGVAQLEERTRRGELRWRPVALGPVARFTADDADLRYTLTGGRDELPTVLTAFNTARRTLLWKLSGVSSARPALQALEHLVTTRFAPAKSPAEPDMSRVAMFPLRRAAAAAVSPLVERSA